MKNDFEFYPTGTCCRLMKIAVEYGKIRDVKFEGGCHGNL